MASTPINWHRFVENLERQVYSAGADATLALIMVSIRQLPIYNYRLGFRHGELLVDKLLQRLAEFLPRALLIERVAPDKLAVLIPTTRVPELLAMSAQRIVDQLAEPFLVNSEIVSVATIVGIAVFPEHGDTAEALVSEAELSLHAALKNARPYHVPTGSSSGKHLMRMQMSSDLQTALADENLSLHYQPKIDLRTMRPKSAETLMRWTLADDTRISPDDFIPVAETSGTIFKLTEWAINTALREGAEINAGGGDYAVAVNLSAGIIYHRVLVDIVESALAIWDLPPQLLALEVTESSLMKNPALCFRNLSAIRERGVRVSIDDFGTGFSSLSYFKDIPADEIKIDQSFVKRMCANAADEKIVGLIVELSHKFDLEVVAEGIETETTLRKLQAMGCDVGQGFYFAKPMNAHSYRRWLDTYDGSHGN